MITISPSLQQYTSQIILFVIQKEKHNLRLYEFIPNYIPEIRMVIKLQLSENKNDN